MQGGAVVACWAHNPKVAGSNPAPAKVLYKLYKKVYNYSKMLSREQSAEDQFKHGLRLSYESTRLRFSPGFWKELNIAARGLSRHPWGNIGQKNLLPVRSCSSLPAGDGVCEANFPHRQLLAGLPMRFTGFGGKPLSEVPHHPLKS